MLVQHGHYPLPSCVQQTNFDFLHILIVKHCPHYPHLSQDVSSARPPVDAGLAEPSLLLLHHQRLRPTRSSGKLHLKHFLNFFLPTVFRLSDISVDCLNFLPTTFSELHLSAVRRVPIGGCTALGPPRSAGLERSGQPQIRDNSISATTPLVVQTSNESPCECHHPHQHQ